MIESYSVEQVEALYQSSQFQKAEKMCRQILIEDSKNPFAMHLLGLIAFKLGRLQWIVIVCTMSDDCYCIL